MSGLPLRGNPRLQGRRVKSKGDVAPPEVGVVWREGGLPAWSFRDSRQSRTRPVGRLEGDSSEPFRAADGTVASSLDFQRGRGCR